MIVGASLATAAHAQVSQTYVGNGDGGFGGAVGNGSLTISDNNAGTLTFTFNANMANGGLNGNAVVLYISTNSGGVTSTATLADANTNDGGRRAISGYYPSNPSDNSTSTRTVLNMPTGFTADFAFSMQDASGDQYAGLFALPPNDGATTTNFTYLTGASQTNTGSITVSIPTADLNLPTGASFNFLASLISNSEYRSNEGFGANDAGSNPGFNGTVDYTSYDTFTTAPEPASLGMLAVGGLMLVRRRTKRATPA